MPFSFYSIRLPLPRGNVKTSFLNSNLFIHHVTVSPTIAFVGCMDELIVCPSFCPFYPSPQIADVLLLLGSNCTMLVPPRSLQAGRLLLYAQYDDLDSKYTCARCKWPKRLHPQVATTGFCYSIVYFLCAALQIFFMGFRATRLSLVEALLVSIFFCFRATRLSLVEAHLLSSYFTSTCSTVRLHVSISLSSHHLILSFTQ